MTCRASIREVMISVLIRLNNDLTAADYCFKLDCSSDDSVSSQPTTSAMDLDRDQLSKFSRNVCHQVIFGVEAVSRGEHGADFAESVVRRAVYDGD